MDNCPNAHKLQGSQISRFPVKTDCVLLQWRGAYRRRRLRRRRRRRRHPGETAPQATTFGGDPYTALRRRDQDRLLYAITRAVRFFMRASQTISTSLHLRFSRILVRTYTLRVTDTFLKKKKKDLAVDRNGSTALVTWGISTYEFPKKKRIRFSR